MSGYFFFSAVLGAVVVLTALALWLAASVVVTYLDPKNAAKIIASMGSPFPLRR